MTQTYTEEMITKLKISISTKKLNLLFWLCPCLALNVFVMSHSMVMFNSSYESRHMKVDIQNESCHKYVKAMLTETLFKRKRKFCFSLTVCLLTK